MKAFIATTALIVATAAGASASTAEFPLFGVDADALTSAQASAVERAIASGGTHSEVQALINSIKLQG